MVTKTLIKLMPLRLRSKIEHDLEVRNILGNINWLAFDNLLRGGLGVIVFALLARYLGPTDFGLMNYALAFTTLFSPIAILGLDSLVVRDLVTYKEKANEYIGSAFVLKLIGSLIMVFLSTLTIHFIRPDDIALKLFVFIISMGYIAKSLDVIDFWFQSKVQAKYIVFARSGALILVTIWRIFLIITKAPLVSFVSMLAIENLVIAVLLAFLYKRVTTSSLLKWRVRIKVIKNFLKDTWPLFLGAISSMIYMRIDQVMIGSMLGDKEVGIYYAAAKLSETWYFIPAIVAASVFPSIMNARKKDYSLYQKRLQQLFDISVWFAVLIAIVVSLASPLIIKVLYGDEYAMASSVLSLHVWSGVFVFLGAIASKWVIAENYTANALLRSVIGAVLNVLLNLYMIRNFGVIGAAISTLISYAFVNYLSLGLFKQTRVCFVMQTRAFNIFRYIGRKDLFKWR